MSEQSHGSLSRTAAAVERLGAAIARLETVSLRAETPVGLAGELDMARDQQEILSDTTREVAVRLDAAIGRLRGLLEE